MSSLNDFSQMAGNVMHASRTRALELRSVGGARSEMANNATTILNAAPDGLQATANNSQAVLNAGVTPSVKPALAPHMTQKTSLGQRMAKLGAHNPTAPGLN